jgi:hypothetical protein
MFKHRVTLDATSIDIKVSLSQADKPACQAYFVIAIWARHGVKWQQ